MWSNKTYGGHNLHIGQELAFHDSLCLISCYELCELATCLFHLQANTPKIGARASSNNKDKVTYLLKLDCPAVCFNDHMMHFAIVNLSRVIRNRAKDCCRHCSQHFLILIIQR